MSDDDNTECPECHGHRVDGEGYQCGLCDGRGWVWVHVDGSPCIDEYCAWRTGAAGGE